MSRVVAIAILLIACGDDGSLGEDSGAGDGGPGIFDGGEFPDAGASDAAPRSDSGGVPPAPLLPSDDPGLAPPAARYEDPLDLGNAGSCYDGEDNDAADMAVEDGLDCDDADCSTLPSCCVARPQNPDCCRSISDGNVLVDIDSCTPGGTPLDCVSGATAFGSPTPFTDDGLALGGDGVFDSGLLFDQSIDLRSANLDLTVDFRQAACIGSCRESAAFGITTQAGLDGDSHVDPDVALVVSGERREARLLVADDVARVWSDVEDGEWRVLLSPDGTVSVARDGGTLEPVATYEPVGEARVVAWGHSRNPGATDDDGIRIQSLNINVGVCDMPRAWTDRSRLLMQITDEVPTTGSTSPSVVLDGAGMPRMAYAQGGEIFLAMQENPSRPERWARQPTAARSDATTTFSEPELVPTPDGFNLYYFSHDSESRTWVVASADGNLDSVDVGRSLSMPSADFAHPSIVPIRPPDRDERFAMAASTHLGIETFASIDGEAWTAHAVVPTDLLDAAEVGEPSLVVVNGGYQLALAVRRGARWSIAMFASAELVHWRLVDERALEAGNQTDRVGVRDLELYVRGSMLEAVYVGLDGVRDSLHHADRLIPSLL